MLEFWFKHYAKYSLTRSNLFPEKGGGELSENKHLCVFFYFKYANLYEKYSSKTSFNAN